MSRITTITIGITLLLSGCWYGPPVTEHRILDTARKPNQFTAVAIIYSQTTRPPKGLATFPNGGIPQLVSSEFSLNLLDPISGTIAELHQQPVPKEVRHAFRADFIGWENDAIYLQLAGCPENECWGDRVQYRRYKIRESGEVAPIDNMPKSAKFKGESYAPMPGERNYIRLGHTFDQITMTTDYQKAAQVSFVLNRKTGKLEVAE